MLISFEGIDGCGKSTQIQFLKDFLIDEGHQVEVYREPGGADLSEAIRSLLLDSRYEPDPVSELLLFSAARSQLISEKVLPSLQAGRYVILDRFFDSTTAYQGYGRGVLSIDEIRRINEVASHGIKPDVTFYLRITLEESIKRTESFEKDRMESAGRDFFQRVIDGYDSIAEQEDRVVVIDGRSSVERVSELLSDVLRTRIK